MRTPFIALVSIWLSGFFVGLGMPFRLIDLVDGLSGLLGGGL